MPLNMTKKPPAPSDIADKFMLRMPDGMRDRIAADAKANGRSMNAEILVRLDQPYLDLSDIGIIAMFKRLEATTIALEELFFASRDLDVSAYVADEAKAGRIISRQQAIYTIVQDWLISHGYLQNTSSKENSI